MRKGKSEFSILNGIPKKSLKKIAREWQRKKNSSNWTWNPANPSKSALHSFFLLESAPISIVKDYYGS